LARANFGQGFNVQWLGASTPKYPSPGDSEPN